LHFFNITGRQLYRLHIPGQYFHNLSLLGVDTKSCLRCDLLLSGGFLLHLFMAVCRRQNPRSSSVCHVLVLCKNS